MAARAKSTENVYGSTVWASYNQYRPAYPPSVWQLIVSYHKATGGHFDAAHDMGAGSGQGASALASHFSTIYVSDPSEHNISNARTNMESTPQHPGGSKHHFAVCAGEDDPVASGFIEAGSLDMVITCEALHWMNIEPTMANVAKTLKPGGTFAAIYYGPKPLVPQHAVAERLLDGLSGMIMRRKMLSPQVLKARAQSATGLEFVGLDDEKWRPGVKRLYINTSPDRETVWNHFVFFEQDDIAQNKTAATDQVEIIDDEASWSKLVDKTWFEGYLETLAPPTDGDAFTQDEHALLNKLRNAVGDAQVRVVWPVHVVMAARA